MKVEVLSASVSRSAGGLFTSVRRLSQELARTGAEVAVSAFSETHTAADAPLWEPLSPQVFAQKGLSAFPVSSEWRQTVLKGVPDLIHNHGIWMYPSLICLAAHRRGIPYVVSPRGMLDPWALKNSAWKKKLAGWAFENRHLRNATCIHALCESEAESIRAYGLKNPIAVIPNGIDLPSLAPQKATKSHKKKRLLFLGRIHPKKGLKELIEAWHLVTTEHTKDTEKEFGWELIIAGWDDGGHEEGLKQQAAELGLWSEVGGRRSEIQHQIPSVGNSIHFVGPQFGDEKDRLLRTVDAFILPSYSEGLPMSVLEAWAYGLPVVMTEFCNLPEGFAAKAAIRITPDPASIRRGLDNLAAMPATERSAMGTRGRELVRDRFTWKKVAEEMLTVYRWCLDGGTPPDCMRVD